MAADVPRDPGSAGGLADQQYGGGEVRAGRVDGFSDAGVRVAPPSADIVFEVPVGAGSPVAPEGGVCGVPLDHYDEPYGQMSGGSLHRFVRRFGPILYNLTFLFPLPVPG